MAETEYKKRIRAEIEYKKRIRVEVSTSIKGVKTFSATIEMIDTPQEEVLAESERLVKELEKRYPPKVE